MKINGVLTNSSFCIRKNKYEDIINILKKYFTVEHAKNLFNEDKEPIIAYREDDEYLYIPKFIANTEIIINDITIKFKCKNTFYYPKEINLTFNKVLREEQIKCVEYVINNFTDGVIEPKGGILHCGCGIGKTIMAIYLICVLKVKTLIIVPQEFLMTQWKNRIEEFCNSKIGIIQQKKIELDNDIVIGMLHTICSKEYTNEFDEFGLVIYDEVHHLGANYFSNILMKTSCKYSIGLSATPKRTDNMHKIIHWNVGDILYTLKRDFSYKVAIKRIFFHSNNKLFVEKSRMIKGQSYPDVVQMKTNLIKINTRNDLIIQIIIKLKNIGRKIFVFSDRIEHLTTLKEGVDLILTENNLYNTNTCFYMGKTSKNDKEFAEQKGDIIFVSIKLGEEGLDIGHLDCVLFALPFKQEKTITQVIGRILRKEILENLLQIPMVIDICDSFSIFKNWNIKRNTVYKKNKYFIQDYYFEYNDLDNNNLTMDNIFDDIIDEQFIEKNLIIKE